MMRVHLTRWLLTAAIAVLGSAPCLAGEAAPVGSADTGRTFANAVCAECHAIEAGAKSSPNSKAPPFASLVSAAKLTAQDIEGWLVSSHKEMPDFAVPADKRADLIAYIKSLALKR